jgi:hypothetical protein
VPAAPEPAVAPLDVEAEEPPVAVGAVAEPPAPLVVALPGPVVVARDPAVAGFVIEPLPAIALEPAAVCVCEEADAPLEPAASGCESSGALEQAGRHSQSNAAETRKLRVKITWLEIIDILLSSRVRQRSTDEYRIGAVRLLEARAGTLSNIDAA